MILCILKSRIERAIETESKLGLDQGWHERQEEDGGIGW